MLTAVFMCQPVGQLVATLVSLIAVANQRGSIPSDATFTSCNDDCKSTMDSIWRWIIGVGVIPAVIALWFRLTIIESPRYTADVGQDSKKAAAELNQYLLIQAQDAEAAGSSTSAINLNPEFLGGSSTRRPSSAPASISPNDGHFAARTSQVSPFDVHRSRTSADDQDHADELPILGLPPAALSDGVHLEISPRLDADFSIQASNQSDDDTTDPAIPPPPSWKDFKQYFWHDGNLRTLIATAVSWFCVDLPFYGLGMNSPHIISSIWYGKNSPPSFIYPYFIQNVWQTLIAVSLGAITGCLITFVCIDKLGRRTIQILGFFWLFILFVVIGGSFAHLYEIGGSSAIIVLYVLCQIFFNFGPNTTSYIVRPSNISIATIYPADIFQMPAELFPTRYRGLSHGISAASGKLGSVIAQLFLAYVNYGHGVNYTDIQLWFPYSLLVFVTYFTLSPVIS